VRQHPHIDIFYFAVDQYSILTMKKVK